MNRRKFFRLTGMSVLAAGIANERLFGCGAMLPWAYEGTSQRKLDSKGDAKSMNNINEAMKHKCKITVLKRECYKDLQNKYLADPDSGPCPYFHEGQEILVDNDNFFHMLDGRFCSEAWDCISRYVYAALQGGSIMRGWTKNEKEMITCCNDGTRPVIFKLERIDEDN